MRHEGAEGLAAKSFGGDGLLLVVEPAAIGILRTNQHSTRGANGSDAIARNCSVDTQGINIISQDLEIVGSPVARGKPSLCSMGIFWLAVIERWQP